MKIIHCADVHLGSAMVNLEREKAVKRRDEIRATFERTVRYAEENGIAHIMLSGDVFDSDRPYKKDKQNFYSVVKEHPQITFYYLRGNHDSRQSYTEHISNLKCFSDKWQSYAAGDVTISGIEIDAGNSSALYSALRLNAGEKNIVMLHGTVGDSDGKDKINLNKLKNKNIDYLALGHIHTFGGVNKLNNRGVWAYSGCLEGRGFDEEGKKGFLVVDTDGFSAEFISFASREVVCYSVDISGATDNFTAWKEVRAAVDCDKRNLLRVELVGEISFDASYLRDEIIQRLTREGYFCVSVKDKSTRKFDISALEGDVSLRGEFVKGVLASGEYDESEKREIISAGLRALTGGEL